MKKTNQRKLQLRKDVIAELGKQQQHILAGGDNPLDTIFCINPTIICGTDRIKCPTQGIQISGHLCA